MSPSTEPATRGPVKVVQFADAAKADVARIDAWWRENRTALFATTFSNVPTIPVANANCQPTARITREEAVMSLVVRREACIRLA